MEDPHGTCDTAAFPQSPRPEEAGCTLTGTGAVSGGLFFFIGSSGNHKANILLEDGFFGVPCEQTERGNGSTSGHRGQ